MADYYPVIARAVPRLPSKTDKARHSIYERARTALQENLRTHDPPVSPAELATEQFVLEAAISRVETELRRRMAVGSRPHVACRRVRGRSPGRKHGRDVARSASHALYRMELPLRRIEKPRYKPVERLPETPTAQSKNSYFGRGLLS